MAAELRAVGGVKAPGELQHTRAGTGHNELGGPVLRRIPGLLLCGAVLTAAKLKVLAATWPSRVVMWTACRKCAVIAADAAECGVPRIIRPADTSLGCSYVIKSATRGALESWCVMAR